MPRRRADHALAAIAGRLENQALRNARRIVVLSEYSRSLVTADHPEAAARVVVVPGGIDTTRFSCGSRDAARAGLGVPHGETILLSVRRLEPGRGLETLLRSFRKISPGDSTRLVIAGDGSLAGALRTMARELDLTRRVQFVGAPTQKALRDWYRAADLFVLPPAPYEGFGLSTLEALASGTPVVAAPVGANRELLYPLDPRLIARSPGPEDLAAAMVAALELGGPELRRRCRDYAAARFDWNLVLNDWETALVNAARAGTFEAESF
jgi:glycosyltransferase involved in cell wall biosynthesis